MHFGDCITALKGDTNLKVTRILWDDIYIYWNEKNQAFNEHTPDTDTEWNWHEWTTLVEDLTSDDWEVVHEIS